MKRPLFCLVFLTLFYYPLFSQSLLKGRVVDNTNQPLSGASVYFNNSSVGTMTSENGHFEINNPLNAELVISSIGFERLVVDLKDIDYAGKAVVFKLEPRQVTLQTVLVLSDAQRKKYLDIFKQHFLGITAEATKCSIENMGDINFFESTRDSFSFEAGSDMPLIVINHALGYRISFDLVQFYYNFKTGANSYFGYTNFEELKMNEDFSERRKKAYLGSSLHFFRSLIENSLEKNKFFMANLKVDSTKKIKMHGAVTFAKKKIPLHPGDITGFDSANNVFLVDWNETLQIGHPSGVRLASSTGYMRWEPAASDNTRSYSYLTKNPATILVDDYGVVLNPMELFLSGDWAFRKVANMLPYNYYPDK